MTKIRKMYKFENKTMKERGVVGIEIDIEKRILYLEQVKGNAPSLECFLELLQIEEIEEALKEATQGYKVESLENKLLYKYKWCYRLLYSMD